MAHNPQRSNAALDERQFLTARNTVPHIQQPTVKVGEHPEELSVNVVAQEFVWVPHPIHEHHARD
jgi:hypothetical protein